MCPRQTSAGTPPLNVNPHISITPLTTPTPPINTKTNYQTSSIYSYVHASTSKLRITSPIIQIPGHPLITTTLTPVELEALFPTLHIYIEPAHPSVAILPAASVSQTGLSLALRWREDELCDKPKGIRLTVPELAAMYQALAFLGQKRTSAELRVLGPEIQKEIREGMSAGEYAEIWALRHLLFTERFVSCLLRGLVDLERTLYWAAANPEFQAALEKDQEVRQEVQHCAEVLKWVESDDKLIARVKIMSERVAWEEKWTGRKGRLKMRSVTTRWKSALETVYE